MPKFNGISQVCQHYNIADHIQQVTMILTISMNQNGVVVHPYVNTMTPFSLISQNEDNYHKIKRFISATEEVFPQNNTANCILDKLGITSAQATKLIDSLAYDDLLQLNSESIDKEKFTMLLKH